jgi:hypothetical protein
VEIGPLLFTTVVPQLSGGQKTTRLSFTHGDYKSTLSVLLTRAKKICADCGP